ncbi:hypothetical protein Q5P01_011993 [Channa striata]|uniref:Reverse transcriptase domain-containing protein n=1 Tax=Channa striata TaxID=64152 RepID=A0AA88SME5_CHASR|nr:hypothetical protein Q5P01_011993 [Channa striata]
MSTYSTELGKVAYAISLLSGKGHEWGMVKWDNRSEPLTPKKEEGRQGRQVSGYAIFGRFIVYYYNVFSQLRQGCPLLFVQYMEPLAAAIKADPGVRGSLVPGGMDVHVKLSQYVDDSMLLLGRDECLIRALEIFESSGMASGTRLNID